MYMNMCMYMYLYTLISYRSVINVSLMLMVFAFKLINVVNIDGESPLDLAVEHRKMAAVQLCLQHGIFS